MRIVSLLPSATEIICGLGLREQLVGVSHECDYPLSVSELPRVTRSLITAGTSSGEIDSTVRQRVKERLPLYGLDAELLVSLAPDLIVTQSLCDVCAVAERDVESAVCSLPGDVRVINLEPTMLEDVLQGVLAVGIAAECESRAERYLRELRDRIAAVKERTRHVFERPRVMLLEWIDPPFSAGHWNPELVELAGGKEVLGVAGERSVSVNWQSIRQADPEILVVACCGFTPERTRQDFGILESYPGWDSLSCVQNNRVHVVDGSAYFSRPGPRLVDSLEILADLIHPS